MKAQARCFGSWANVHHRVPGDRWLAVVQAVLVALVGKRADEPDLAPHVAALDPEHGADDQDVDAEPADELGRLAVDAAVDLDLAFDGLWARY